MPSVGNGFLFRRPTVPKTASRRQSVMLACALATSLAACSESPDPTSPVSLFKGSGSQAQIQQAVAGRQARAFEDDLLRLEATIPSLGGIFQDKSGNLVVFLTDLRDEQLARRELGRQHALFRADPATQSKVRTGIVEFRKADFTFSQLVDWQSTVVNKMATLPGLQSVDADEAKNRVRIGLLADADRNRIEAALGALGLTKEAVLIELAERPVAINLRSRFPNGTAGGMGITNSLNATGDPKYCTIGFNVTTNLGENGFLTAGHCDPNHGSGTTGEDIYQNLAPYKIGDVTINPAFSGSVLADAMFVLRSAGAPTFNPWVAITSYKGINNNGGSITEVAWQQDVRVGGGAYVGILLDKVGRTTGWTDGTVSSTCTAEVVTNGGHTYTVTCSNRVDNSAIGQGDSGAPVYDEVPRVGGGTYFAAYGIIFAGNPQIGDPNYYDIGDGTFHCRAPLSCYYLYSAWGSIGAHLGRTFNP